MSLVFGKAEYFGEVEKCWYFSSVLSSILVQLMLLVVCNAQ